MVFEVVIDEQHYGKESIDKASRTIESAGAAGDVRWLQPLARAHVGNARLRGFFHVGFASGSLCLRIPDVGLLGLHEMVESVRRITNVTDIPVFADADTGYGNAVNVYYTVQAYIRAGAAGLHIEDQEAPKKSGTQSGRRLISAEEAIGKFKAAVAAKLDLDADFVVCARCDSIGSEGGSFEDAVRRAVAYVKEANVDAVWMNT